jgi:hypothetical protein
MAPEVSFLVCCIGYIPTAWVPFKQYFPIQLLVKFITQLTLLAASVNHPMLSTFRPKAVDDTANLFNCSRTAHRLLFGNFCLTKDIPVS